MPPLAVPTHHAAGQRRLVPSGIRRILPEVAGPTGQRVAAVLARPAHVLGPQLPRGFGLPTFRLCERRDPVSHCERRNPVPREGVSLALEGGVSSVTLCSGAGFTASSRTRQPGKCSSRTKWGGGRDTTAGCSGMQRGQPSRRCIRRRRATAPQWGSSR